MIRWSWCRHGSDLGARRRFHTDRTVAVRLEIFARWWCVWNFQRKFSVQRVSSEYDSSTTRKFLTFFSLIHETVHGRDLIVIIVYVLDPFYVSLSHLQRISDAKNRLTWEPVSIVGTD